MITETGVISPYHQDSLALVLDSPPFELNAEQKKLGFLARMRQLCCSHYARCDAYRRILTTQGITQPRQILDIDSLEALPFLTVPLFKQFFLSSIPREQVYRVLRSSGTTSQTPSVIALDSDTARLQSKVLVKVMQGFTGKKRCPMLIIDAPPNPQSAAKAGYSARGAGIQGFSLLGRDHTYGLDHDMKLNRAVLEEFIHKHENQKVLIFGFTHLVWEGLLGGLQKLGLSLDLSPNPNQNQHKNQSVLIHGGGWKKLQRQAVTNEIFKQKIAEYTGIADVHNYYGMAEQVGSVFVECEHGFLHAPFAADLLVRDRQTLQPLANGNSGLLQVLSLLPMSYPGHSILTEDLGYIVGEDNCPCGRKGKYFQVTGRMTTAENRGCSDTATAKYQNEPNQTVNQ